MGTRGLTVVVCGGEYKIAQYGQWDHYPNGQGRDICNFIRNEMHLDKFREAVKECKFLDKEEITGIYKKCEDEHLSLGNYYPQLSRDTGGKILSLVQNGARELYNSITFAGESLYCEYAYVVDLDNEVLEVYKGFNKTPLDPNERFYGFATENNYDPVKLVAKFPFNDLSDDTMSNLEKLLSEEDE